MINAHALKILTVLLESSGYYIHLENNSLIGRTYEATKSSESNHSIIKIDLEQNRLTVNNFSDSLYEEELILLAFEDIEHINNVLDVINA